MRVDSGSAHRERILTWTFALLLIGTMGVSYWSQWQACLSATHGHFAYSLDDPYIHLAIAKSLAMHGVWGLTPYEAASASSSPLWTLLLAGAIKVGGDSQFWPLAFGILSCFATVLGVYLGFLRRQAHPGFAAIVALIVFASGPLLGLPFMGMEHCLQIFVVVTFAFRFSEFIEGEPGNTSYLWMACLVGAMCLSRFECVFLVPFTVGICVVRKDWKLVAAISGGAFVSLLCFGVVSYINGFPLLPSSVLLKGKFPHGDMVTSILAAMNRSGYGVYFGSLTVSNLFFAAMATGIGLRYRHWKLPLSRAEMAVWLAVSTTLIHTAFAAVGPLYRYEAYLVVLLVLANLGGLIELTGTVHSQRPFSLVLAPVVMVGTYLWYRPDSTVVMAGLLGILVVLYSGDAKGQLLTAFAKFAAVLLFACSVLVRSVSSYFLLPKGCLDIASQQIQMSRFIAKYYPKGRVAVNDIGAVSYFNDLHLLDLWGLGSPSILRLKLTNSYDTAHLARVLDSFKPDLMMIYPTWFEPPHALPDSWIQCGAWRIPTIVSAGHDTVAFYAPNEKSAKKLRAQLKAFRVELPERVETIPFHK